MFADLLVIESAWLSVTCCFIDLNYPVVQIDGHELVP